MGAQAKTLVAYYSYTNNIHRIVSELQKQTTVDAVRIEPAEKGLDYAADNYAIGSALISAIRNNPADAGSYPAIDPVTVNWDEYDTVIIGTPLWWSNMAAPMQTFLFHNADKMAGKKIGLIVSSASSGISAVVADAKRLIPNGNFVEPELWIRSHEVAGCSSTISDWLHNTGLAQALTEANKLHLSANGMTMTATLVENSSTAALKTLLSNGPVTISMRDYANMEKVGPLPQSLPRNDEPTDTEAGDLILYQGNSFVIYYDTNSWNFTRLGKIDGLSSAELKNILGPDNVNVTLSLPEVAGINEITANHADDFVIYNLAGRLIKAKNNDINSLSPGVYIINGEKRIIE